MTQAPLPFEWPADTRDADFIVTPSNAAAVRHLDRPALWPVAASLLVGPRKSGRSTLARRFVAATGGTMIDDADRADERALFTAWNDAQSSRKPLLMIAEVAPPTWVLTLPDLKSRLAATPVATIGPPDDDLIGRLLARLLERRGLPLALDVRAYLIPRAQRSHHAVIALADALDAASLARGGPVTIPLARAVLSPLASTGLGDAAIDAGGQAG